MKTKFVEGVLICMLILSACTFSNSNIDGTGSATLSTTATSDSEVATDIAGDQITGKDYSDEKYESIWTTLGAPEEDIYTDGGMIFYCKEFTNEKLTGKIVNVTRDSHITAEIAFYGIGLENGHGRFNFMDEWGNTGEMFVTRSEVVMNISVEDFTLANDSPEELNMNSEYFLVKVSDIATNEERSFDVQAGIKEPVSIPEFVRYEDKATITGNGVDGGEMSFEKDISLAYLSSDSEILFSELYQAISQVADDKRAYIKEQEDGFNKEIQEIADGTWQVEHADEIGVVGYPEKTVHERADYLKRVDSEYVSLLSVENDFVGQSSISAYYGTYNYNVHTGENIKISDIITDKEALRYYLVREILLMNNEYHYFDLYLSLSKIDEFIDYDYEGIVEDEYSRGFTWYLDSLGVNFIFQPYDIGRNSVWITIPYASKLVSEKYLPFKGQDIISEDDDIDLKQWNMRPELGRNIEYYLPTFSEDKSVNDIFIQTIKTLESTGYMPNGEYCYGSEEDNYSWEKDISYQDSVAACDVTGDGNEELLITIEGAYSATISQWIFSYNADKKEFEKVFVSFSTEFFEGGIVKCVYSHGDVYEDDFWPYDLYHYDSQNNEYVFVASVNSKQLLHDYETGELDEELNKDFPYDEDKDKDGKVYIVSINGESVYMDNDEYEAWKKQYIDESKRISPDWHEIAKTAVIE